MLENDLKNLIMSFEENDFFKRVDMHIHSNVSDGKMTPEYILDCAKKLDMKFISIADHNSLNAYTQDKLCDSILIPAVEFDCWYKGVLIHILGYGIDVENKELQKLLAKKEAGRKHNLYRVFHLRDPKKVISAIKGAGGIAILAHPACYWCFNLDSFIQSLIPIGLDGIEVYYPYRKLRGVIKFHSRKLVYNIAQKYNLLKTGGSDTHDSEYYNFSLTTLSM